MQLVNNGKPKMANIIHKGPCNIIIRGKRVPAWFIDSEGHRYEYESMAILDEEGRFDMDKLQSDQCILFPGVIYQLKEWSECGK